METWLFLGEPARNKGKVRGEEEQMLQKVGVLGCGAQRKPSSQGPRDIAEEGTAQSRFVTLCQHLINQSFCKHNLYSRSRFSSALPLNSNSIGA
jgi:hypothetical protein